MENNKNFNRQLILTAGFHGFIIPDDAHDKIIEVDNSLVGHSGLGRCLKRLTNRLKTDVSEDECLLKTPIHGHPFTTSTYEPMIRLNIDFMAPLKMAFSF